MKKILIALPLVLIMILSMVPVFAGNKDVATTIKYYNGPLGLKDTKLDKEVKMNISVDEKVLTDKAKLEAAIKAAVEKMDKPQIETKTTCYQWKVVPTATPQTQDAKSYLTVNVLIDTAKGYTLSQLDALVKEVNGVKANAVKLEGVDVAKDGAKFINDTAVTKVNTAVDAAANSDQTQPITLEAGDLNDKNPTNTNTTLHKLTAVEGKVHEASAVVDVYPSCELEPTDEPEEVDCYIPCDYITVRVFNGYTHKYLDNLEHKFQVVKGRIPEISAAIEYMKQVVNRAGYMLAYDYALNQAIFLPERLDNCTATLVVIPSVLEVNVIHELYNCCKNPDGTISQNNGLPYMSFIEENQVVPFLEFTAQRVINQVKAEEWATTRIQKLNSGEWVFESAQFVDVLNPGRYLTGKIIDANGNEIGDIQRWYKARKIEIPTIIIKYRAAVCVEKTEEKVDNATVENANANTAPVTANGGANLPATGAKDVSAFFLSAVALLGLGIFFAKKH